MEPAAQRYQLHRVLRQAEVDTPDASESSGQEIQGNSRQLAQPTNNIVEIN
jgi:hypothetical protein